VLTKAGVVDAGAYGIVLILSGVVAGLRGKVDTLPELPHHEPVRTTRPHHEDSRFRYCTNFIVTGSGLEPRSYVPRLEELGDSVLVVGDEATLKVHVHTDEPEDAVALFEKAGAVQRLDVADMREQIAAREERLGEPGRTGVVAVASGDGIKALYEELGAHVVDGGPTLNPSTYELLAGIHEVRAEQVVVLPNSPNVFMAAEHAAELSEKTVRVSAARSQQAGLAAAVALDPDRSAAENLAAFDAALERLRTGAVARAARDDLDGRFAAGDAVGFVDEQIVAWGEPQATLGAIFASLGSGAELLTCIAGYGAPLTEDDVRALAPDSVELEYEVGGQPSYWWLLAAE
ncbi:MAG: hypothetical protein ACRDLS_04145, partial [Solirubrobacteraceae bacterium]